MNQVLNLRRNVDAYWKKNWLDSSSRNFSYRQIVNREFKNSAVFKNSKIKCCKYFALTYAILNRYFFQWHKIVQLRLQCLNKDFNYCYNAFLSGPLQIILFLRAYLSGILCWVTWHKGGRQKMDTNSIGAKPFKPKHNAILWHALDKTVNVWIWWWIWNVSIKTSLISSGNLRS